MIRSKNLVAAFILIFLLAASNIASADGKMYVEGGFTYSLPGDVDAEFTTENTTASWGLSSMTGGKVQVGSDFGNIRVDAKLQYLEGDVDDISGGVTNVTTIAKSQGPNAALGVATLNFYYDIDLKKGDKDAFTPYVGFGIGMARGFMQAQGTLVKNGGSLREDHRTSDGTAIAGIAGAFFKINDKAGITTEYEYLDVDFGGLSNHSFSAGLRLSF
jgi:outer membrane protein W